MQNKNIVLSLSALLLRRRRSSRRKSRESVLWRGSGIPNTPGLQVEAFRQGLRELGYVEGKNILIEYRYVEAKVDRIPTLVAELDATRDRCVSGTGRDPRGQGSSTKSIPIVIVALGDPVAEGLLVHR